MATEILAPGVGPGTSTDIVVAVGAPVTVGLFRNDEEKIEGTCRGVIYKQDPNGNWNQTTVTLNRDTPQWIFAGEGTYQVRRTGGFLVATGVQTD